MEWQLKIDGMEWQLKIFFMEWQLKILGMEWQLKIDGMEWQLKIDGNEWQVKKDGMEQSSRNLLRCCWTAVRQSENFVGQERKMSDKNNRVLLFLNAGLFIFSKHCKLDGKYSVNMCNLHLSKTKSPKNTVWAFSKLFFLSDKLCGKLTKFD